MNIIAMSHVSGIWEQIIMNCIATAILIFLGFALCWVTKEEKFVFIKIGALFFFILYAIFVPYGWFNTEKMSNSYDVIEVNVYDWNEVMGNNKYKVILRDGDYVKLKVLD